MTDTTRADERQAELAQVRRAHQLVEHHPAPPPAPDPQAALDAARHREGLARMLAPVVQLSRVEDDPRLWSSEEKRAARQARRDAAAEDAIDRLTHHRREEP